MSLEDIERGLYAPEPENKPEQKSEVQPTPAEQAPTQAEQKINLPNAWQASAPVETTPIIEVGKKVAKAGQKVFWSAISAVVFLLIFGGIFVYRIYFLKNINIVSAAPNTVFSNIPFIITADISNDSPDKLSNAEFYLELPKNVYLENDRENRIYKEAIGTMEPNATTSIKISVVAENLENSIIDFVPSIKYSGSDFMKIAQIKKGESLRVFLKEAGVKITFSAPQKILRNEKSTIKVDISNVSGEDLGNLSLSLNIPESFFSVQSSTPTSSQKLKWQVPKLANGKSFSASVIGTAIGKTNSFFEILAETKQGEEIIGQKSANINIAAAPLEANISVAKRQNNIELISPQDDLNYSIALINNSDIAFSDVSVSAKITGEIFDLTSLNKNLFYNTGLKSIIWNAQNTPDLKQIEPNETKIIDFSITAKESYPIKKTTDKNLIAKISVTASSPTVPYYVSGEKTIASAEIINKVAGVFTFTPQIKKVDSSLGITNKGSLPLQANKITELTIHWKASATANDMDNVEIRAFLEPNVKWTGKTKTTLGTLKYNETTQEIIWTIPKLPANKGILSAPAETIFQISATPSLADVGATMPLIRETSVKAVDNFTEAKISTSSPALNSSSIAEAIVNSTYKLVK